MFLSVGCTATRVTQVPGSSAGATWFQFCPRSSVHHSLPSSVPTYNLLPSVGAAAIVVIVPHG